MKEFLPFTAIPISEKESVSALMNEERGVVASMTLNTRFDYVRVGSVPLLSAVETTRAA